MNDSKKTYTTSVTEEWLNKLVNYVSMTEKMKLVHLKFKRIGQSHLHIEQEDDMGFTILTKDYNAK